jgi:hypothetical protein
MPYRQDDFGQWWYVAKNYRSRAFETSCLECGATFVKRRTDNIRFCSKACAQSGPRSSPWRGGRYVQKGYVLVRLRDDSHPAASMRNHGGYVPEHRMLMAEALRRPLSRTETVHHINGDKADNRLENLELRAVAHGPGVRLRCAECGSSNVQPVPLANGSGPEALGGRRGEQPTRHRCESRERLGQIRYTQPRAAA